MKIRRSILWCCAVVAVLIALVIWFTRKPVETNAVPDPATEQVVKKSNPREAKNTNTPITEPAAAANAPAPLTQTKAAQVKEGLATLNDVPILFYGKLEDQFGNPVASAEITGSTIIYSGVKSGVGRFFAISDASGLFQINAGSGESLGVMPTKEGYALATIGTEFKYSSMYDGRHVPDINNPVVFKMWKLQGAEPLVKIDQNYKLHYSNSQFLFDLLVGKVVSTGGDLKITVNRPSGIISEQHPQDWSVDFEVVDGGFVSTSVAESRVTYSAPESGYQSSGVLANRKGSDVVDHMFFFKSRGGKVYGKIRFSFRINNTPDGFMYGTISGVANTNGSPNWEGDPNTMKPQ